MAILHHATLKPTKLELLVDWLPTNSWYRASAQSPVLNRVATCRFDDPAGEVGVETLLVEDAASPAKVLYHVPLTYRGAPLVGAESFLVGTMDHSVLGKRWVYDACGDPVYVAALSGAILGKVSQAQEFHQEKGQLLPKAPSLVLVSAAVNSDVEPGTLVRVKPGDPTVVITEHLELRILRTVPAAVPADTEAVLRGTWAGQDSAVPLAVAARP